MFLRCNFKTRMAKKQNFKHRKDFLLNKNYNVIKSVFPGIETQISNYIFNNKEMYYDSNDFSHSQVNSVF